MWVLALLFATAAAAQDGASLYQLYCLNCHGPRGDGGKGASLAQPRLQRARTDADLANVITFGIEGTEMPPTRMTEAELGQLVAFVRSLAQRPKTGAKGDAARGRQVYLGKANCAQCHMISGHGGRMGPELTEVGGRRSPAHLRESIVDPEANIPNNFAFYRRMIYFPDNFLQVRVVARDGRQITGVRLNEDPFTIQIRDFEDRLHHFEKSDLAELGKDWGKSPMPSYRASLSESELDDLVAYLASLRGTP